LSLPTPVNSELRCWNKLNVDIFLDRCGFSGVTVILSVMHELRAIRDRSNCPIDRPAWMEEHSFINTDFMQACSCPTENARLFAEACNGTTMFPDWFFLTEVPK
jgi:hypothetical protein